jgi:hypothetical protein
MSALRLQRVDPATGWADFESYEDRHVFQGKPWIDFIVDSQGAQPVCAVIKDGTRTVGRFSGAIVRKWGLPLLGSSFPGWTTPYIGFNLREGYDRADALPALSRFAFKELGVWHLEVSDRGFDADSAARAGFIPDYYDTYESDLTQSEADLFARMSSACRRCIRKAEKLGLRIVECDDDRFAAEYYAQLQDVFAKQGKVPTYGQERVESLIRHLRPTGQLLMLRAVTPNGECVGTGLYPALNSLAEFWGNASWRQHQNLRPNESLHWYAMRYWKSRGVRVFDWGGGGTYKEKYGVAPVRVPWLRKSRTSLLESARGWARSAFELKQRMRARRSLSEHGDDTVEDSGDG